MVCISHRYGAAPPLPGGRGRWSPLVPVVLWLALGPSAAAQSDNDLRRASSRPQVVVVGSGLTGLCAGALLAKQDYEVTVLEMHPTLIGGHARTLTLYGLEVTAGPQYVWNFGPGQVGWQVLHRLGLVQQQPFDLLNPDSFDQLIVDDEVLDVPIGLRRWRNEVIGRFPTETAGLDRFFATIEDLFDAASFLHDSGLYLAQKPAMILGLACTPTLSLRAKLRTLRYSESALSELFDDCSLSQEVRRFLYGQGGLFAENESEVSVVVYAAGIGYFHRGPRVPRFGFQSLIDGLGDVIRSRGGAVLNGKKVVELVIRRQRVTEVRCEDGSRYPADIVISTLSPRLTARLVPGASLRRFDYEPSNSLVACYLKVTDFPAVRQRLDGRNIWWQAGGGPVDYFDPDMTTEPELMFVGSPTANQQGLGFGSAEAVVLFAPGNFDQARQAADQGSAAHEALRQQIAEVLVDVLDREIFPGIRDQITALRVITPWDIREELGAERGNAYGRRLDAFNLLHSETSTPYARNLHVTNASIGLPGVATAFQTAHLLVPADGMGVEPIPLIIVKAISGCLFRDYRESIRSYTPHVTR